VTGVQTCALPILSFRGVDYQTPDAMPEHLDSDQK
jgi:hypothetical protein